MADQGLLDDLLQEALQDSEAMAQQLARSLAEPPRRGKPAARRRRARGVAASESAPQLGLQTPARPRTERQPPQSVQSNQDDSDSSPGRPATSSASGSASGPASERKKKKKKQKKGLRRKQQAEAAARLAGTVSAESLAAQEEKEKQEEQEEKAKKEEQEAESKKKQQQPRATSPMRAQSPLPGPAFVSRANDLADADNLSRFLASEEAGLAMGQLGLSPEEVLPRQRSYFEREPNRAWKVDALTARTRHEHFDEVRKKKLAQLLARMESVREATAALNERTERVEKRTLQVMETTLQRQLRLAQEAEARMARHMALVEHDNAEATEQRGRHGERMDQRLARERAIAEKRDMQKKALEERAAARQRKFEEAAVARERAKHAKHSDWDGKAAAQQARVAEFRKARLEANREKREKEAEFKRNRQLVSDEFRLRDEATRQELQARMNSKEAHIATLQAKRQERLKISVEQKWLRARDRQLHVQQMRKAMEHKRMKQQEKIEADNRRIELMQSLREALEADRKEKAHMALINKHRWQDRNPILHNVSPGPGEYGVQSTLKSNGGAWGSGSPKSDVEWRMYHASKMPGPGQYYNPQALFNKDANGGRFSHSNRKSYLDLQINLASTIPGPGQYEVKPLRANAPVCFASSESKSDLELQLDRARDEPAPGQYAPSALPPAKPKLKELRAMIDKQSLSSS